jgi:hypothetical protein
MQIKRIVIDVLLPHEPSVLVYAERIGKVNEVDGVTISVLEIDEKTRTVEMTIEGNDIPFDVVKGIVEELGGSIHSIDEVSTGSRIVKPRRKRNIEQ